MIGGIEKGSDFTGLIHYLFDGRSRGSVGRGILLGGTVLDASGCPDELIDAFARIRGTRPDIERPVMHVWASCAEGESLDGAAWLWIGQNLADRFGTDAWIAVGHDDSRCAHAHFAFSRIRWDGSVAREFLRDFRIVESVMAEAEARFHLQVAPRPARSPGPHGRTPQRHRASNRENRIPRGRRPSMKTTLRQAIQDCEAAGHRGYRLLLALQALGWTSDVTWRHSRPVGLVWRHESGFAIGSRRLGDAYRAPAFFRRIGGLPGMQGGRPLPRNWTPPPYHFRGFGSYLKSPARATGVASGCTWWGRTMSWAWQAVRSVVAAAISLPEPTRPVPQLSIPNTHATANSALPTIAPRRR